MTRRLGVFTALLVLAFSAGTARPASAEATWADLTRRIVMDGPRGPYNVVAGGVPAGFSFPANVRPALPIVGAVWFDLLPGTPQHVHVYFAATQRTTEAVKTLIERLRAAHFTKSTQWGYVNAFITDTKRDETWCSEQQKGYTVQFGVRDVAGVPALDIQFSASGMLACGPGAGPLGGIEIPAPVLSSIPGMEIFAGLRGTESGEHSLGSFAVIRTSLSPTDALAKLAERFTADGWTARPPVPAGATVLQHFSRVRGPFRWSALLVLEPRPSSSTLYDAALDITPDPIEPGNR
jgi:hypothetical protein